MLGYRIFVENGRATLRQTATEMRDPGPDDVRIRIQAASLNFRDLIVLDGAAASGASGSVPLSDGAGVIDAIGDNVSQWTVGDRVISLFFPDWRGGRFKSQYDRAPGDAQCDGFLTTHAIVPANAVVRAPAKLSMIEAATLPCAGVTAWHALFGRSPLTSGESVLIQGTGGVALFALQFAKAAGARVVMLSSSDAKLERARTMGADVLINYRAHPDWDGLVRDATDGVGVDRILELGGPDTYDRSIAALAAGGSIVQIGVLSGFEPRPNLLPLMFKSAEIQGILVGSAEHATQLTEFYDRGETGPAAPPVIDRVFTFDQAEEAYAALRAARHFGKIVIDLADAR